MKHIKAYSYIRMSTEKQLGGDSLQRQLEKTQQYASEQGWELDDSLRDLGVSAFKGKNVEGGALGNFIELCREGEIKKGSVLIVENLDRMSRQRPIDAFNVFTSILKLGIDIVVLDDKIHFTEDNMDMGNLFISIGGMVRAHAESERKSQLITSVWKNKRKNLDGTKILTGRCPGWLKPLKDSSGFEVIDEQAETVRRIFQLCIDGYGYGTIASFLNDENVPTLGYAKSWHQSTITNTLKSKATIGYFQPHAMVGGKRQPVGDMIPEYYPAIIEETTYYKAQEALESRAHHRDGAHKDRQPNLFSGLMKCEVCGGPMTYGSWKTQKPPYKTAILRCYNSTRGSCDQKQSIKYAPIEELALDSLRELVLMEPDDKNKSKRKSVLERLETTRAKLKTVKDRRKKLLLQFADTDDTTIVELVQELGEEEKNLQTQVDELSKTSEKVKAPRSPSVETVDNILAYQKLTENADDETVVQLRKKIAGELKNILESIVVDVDGTCALVAKNTGSKYVFVTDPKADMGKVLDGVIWDNKTTLVKKR